MWIVAGQRGELLEDENHHEIELRPQSAPGALLKSPRLCALACCAVTPP